MKSRWYTRVEEASNFESNGCINLDYASDDHSFQWVPDVLTSQKSLYGIMFSQPFGTRSPLISKMGIRTTKEFGLSYFVCEKVSLKEEFRLRAVSYFSLQSYCTRNPSMRAVKPRGAINEGWRRVCLLRKSPQSVFSRLVPIPYCNITSGFAIALAEIRRRTASSLEEVRKAELNESKELSALPYKRDDAANLRSLHLGNATTPFCPCVHDAYI